MFKEKKKEHITKKKRKIDRTQKREEMRSGRKSDRKM